MYMYWDCKLDYLFFNKHATCSVKKHLSQPPAHTELRQRHVTPRPPVPVTPNLAVVARPPPGPTAPPALISAPGGPPERNLSTSAQNHNLLRRNATPTGPPSPGVGK